MARWPEYFQVAESPAGDLMGYIMGKSEGLNENWHGHVTAVRFLVQRRLWVMKKWPCHAFEDVQRGEEAFSLRWMLDQSTADLVLPTAWWKALRRSRTARTATSSTSSSGSLYITPISWTDITSQGEQQDRHQLLQQAWLHCLPDRSSVLQWRQWRRCVSVQWSGWDMSGNLKCTLFVPGTTCGKRWPWMWRRKVWSLFPPLWACCHGWWLLGWPCWFSLLSYSPFTHLWVSLTTLLMQLIYFLFQVHMDEMDY